MHGKNNCYDLSENEKTVPKDAAIISALNDEVCEGKRLGCFLGLTLCLCNLSIGLMIILNR
ncbi:hypothetical protein Sjap_004141 [Stephania japonica]|uniref:Uncharacterized protein n=1 Tax=Stephania japonica TaxID=461633 RepID=A0AAP0K1R5_9MAGN